MTAEILKWILPGEVPVDSTAVRIVFERPLPAWAWLLVVAGAIAVAVWSYRRLQGANRTFSRAVRTALVVLRSCSLVLVAFLMSGPSARFERTSVERDRMIVLVDRSRSLAIADAPGGATREEQLRGILSEAAPVFREIARGKDIDFVGFSGGAFALPAAGDAQVPEIGAAEGDRSDIDAAIRHALSRNAGRPVSGIVVLSDGRATGPVSPETLRMCPPSAAPERHGSSGRWRRLLVD